MSQHKTATKATKRARRARRRGREYLRVSLDRSGRQKSNTEQHDENNIGCEEHGIDLLAEAYSDVGSASRGKAKRDDFERLCAELRGSTFGAEVLVLWESSRGSRTVGEWCTLIDICEAARVLIFVTTHNRLYDCSNPRDRRSLQEDAVDSEYETAKIGLRVTRDHAAAAKAGRPAGPIPFGYRRIVDEERKLHQLPDKKEAPKLQRYCDEVLAGTMTVAEIALEMGRTMTGVRVMLTNPSYAGLRVFKGNTYQGDWPALISVEQHRALVELLSRKNTGPRATPLRRYPYTGLLFCGVCGSRLTCRKANNTDRFRRYICSAARCRKVCARADELDAYLEGQLDRTTARIVTGDPRDDSKAVRKLRERQALLAARHDEILGAFNSHDLSMSEYQSMRDHNEAERAEVDAELAERAGSFDLSVLLTADGRPITLLGKEVDDARRKAVAGRLVESATVMPSGRHKVPVWSELVHIEWRKRQG